jgi:hypothetical protein
MIASSFHLSAYAFFTLAGFSDILLDHLGLGFLGEQAELPSLRGRPPYSSFLGRRPSFSAAGCSWIINKYFPGFTQGLDPPRRGEGSLTLPIRVPRGALIRRTLSGLAPSDLAFIRIPEILNKRKITCWC